MRHIRGWKSASRGRRQWVIFIRIFSLPFIRTETTDLRQTETNASFKQQQEASATVSTV